MPLEKLSSYIWQRKVIDRPLWYIGGWVLFPNIFGESNCSWLLLCCIHGMLLLKFWSHVTIFVSRYSPVEVVQQLSVGHPVRHKSPVRKPFLTFIYLFIFSLYRHLNIWRPYNHHPPHIVEEESLEEGAINQISLESHHLAPKQSFFRVFFLLWDHYGSETRQRTKRS